MNDKNSDSGFVHYVRTCHDGQYRNYRENFILPAIPYTDHLKGVASILSSCLSAAGECVDPQALCDMRDAALGHDLLEDTDATEANILSLTSEHVLHLIRDLTNPVDDAHTDAYMEQIRNASEEVRLIKYADLIENTSSVCYSLHIVGSEWVESFYLPILRRTTVVLAATYFVVYKRTAELMRNILSVYTELLQNKR